MKSVADLAVAVEAAVGPLLDVLDSARNDPRLPVSATQFRVLTILARRPGLNLGGLAEALDVVPSSASRLCDRLAATGLITRAPDPRDRREVHLTLTSTATELLEDLRQRRCDAIEGVLTRMPAGSRRALLRSLTAFAMASEAVAIEAAKAIEAIPPDPGPSADGLGAA
ncbi:MarR family transcriptional regulator [Catenuloplanes atrovinosus]|uniref:DNA-binding MarR family transcriptional regulator n=1 Tax=Catenuloplanes atrovinosus TaxID=137266 RepID=A0AAE4C7I1_9ACTN|nr:MarR family transcriptional regulator [Catenuloplanes atrovinosus]MDR7273913.1 DNA-binding MarR family transcriptional regulator [Catenuloplanes atrovinosus]